MSIIQKEYKESEECKANSQQEFACLTVCLADNISDLFYFYFARAGSSVVDVEGCANTEINGNKMPYLLKQMYGLQRWYGLVREREPVDEAPMFGSPMGTGAPGATGTPGATGAPMTTGASMTTTSGWLPKWATKPEYSPWD